MNTFLLYISLFFLKIIDVVKPYISKYVSVYKSNNIIKSLSGLLSHISYNHIYKKISSPVSIIETQLETKSENINNTHLDKIKLIIRFSSQYSSSNRCDQ
jgi:hypothetical protein